VKKVAVIADVHGNAPAFAAVLDEIEREQPDLIVSCGDLTWGPLPEETFELARGLDARFVRGNADRAVLEGVSGTEREQWMQAHHSDEMRDFLGTFEEQVVVEVDALGPVRFSHGSPRSDEECVTPETPEERVREFSAGVGERTIVTAHVHIQFDREVAGIRSVNAGSVGLPYEGRQGAYWALLGVEERTRGQSPHVLQRAPQAAPLVELRRTEYDVDATVERYRASGQPNVEQIVEMMLTPPERREVIDHAEKHAFAG
jgi:putative phosphoesterase